MIGLNPDVVIRHLDASPVTKLQHHIRVAPLIQRQIGKPQAEALGKAGVLLQGLPGVDVIPLPVGEAFPDHVPAVGGGINDHVVRHLLQAALQGGLQGGEALVLLIEGQVVDVEDKLLGVIPYQTGQSRQLVQRVFGDLNEPEVEELRDMDQGLDGMTGG